MLPGAALRCPPGGSMPVRQRLLRLAPALIFLLVNLFLALSLGGYDPADAPGSGAEPANQSPLLSNPCGPVGATLAHVSFNVLGWSSWLLLLGLVAVNVLVVARREVADRVSPVARLCAGAGSLRGHDPQVCARPQAEPPGGQRRIHRRPCGDLPVQRSLARTACSSSWFRPGLWAWCSATTCCSPGRSGRF